MARSDERKSDNRQSKGGGRDRKRDKIINGVKDRPYTAAAVATIAGAAGAAAYFLSRKSEDKPLMNWGKSSSESDSIKGAGAYKPQGSTTNSSTLETASRSPSSSAGLGATREGVSDNRTTGTSDSATSALATGTTGSSSTKGAKSSSKASGSTGLDETAKDQTKVGSVAYGA
jgi:hypothetical protein